MDPSWYFRVDVFIDGAANTFFRVQVFYWHLVVVLKAEAMFDLEGSGSPDLASSKEYRFMLDLINEGLNSE